MDHSSTNPPLNQLQSRHIRAASNDDLAQAQLKSQQQIQMLQYTLQNKFAQQQSDLFNSQQHTFNSPFMQAISDQSQHILHQPQIHQRNYESQAESSFPKYQVHTPSKVLAPQIDPIEVLREWLHSHGDHTPSEEQIKLLMLKTSLSRIQITNWIENERNKKWKGFASHNNGALEPHEYLKDDSSDDENSRNAESYTITDSAESAQYLSSNFIEDQMYDDEYSGDGSHTGMDNQNQENLPKASFKDSNANLSMHGSSGNLPKNAVDTLKQWLFDHFQHPYPTDEEKSELAIQTKLNLTQVNNWFINARRR
jgi:hypothetical protein